MGSASKNVLETLMMTAPEQQPRKGNECVRFTIDILTKLLFPLRFLFYMMNYTTRRSKQTFFAKASILQTFVPSSRFLVVEMSASKFTFAVGYSQSQRKSHFRLLWPIMRMLINERLKLW